MCDITIFVVVFLLLSTWSLTVNPEILVFSGIAQGSHFYCSRIHKIQGVSAKTFEPNNPVIFQRIFIKFKMQIF
jgi:hypothetical protein